MKYSFIIPSFNSHATISRTIRSIIEQTRRDLIREIIVVDSSTNPESRKCLYRLARIVTKDEGRRTKDENVNTFQRSTSASRVPRPSSLVAPAFSIIELSKQTGPAASRNVGAGSAAGDVLCFIDSDVELTPDWLKNVDAAVRQGCRLGGGSIAVASEQTRNFLSLAQYYLQFNEFMNVGRRHQVPFLPSCNLFCERELFVEAGGFPEIRASEDTLFCLRAGKLAPVWFVPEAECRHIFRQEWSKFVNNQIVLGKYVLIYRKMYYNAFLYKGLWPLVLLPAFLFVKLLRIVKRIINGGFLHVSRYIVSLPVFAAGLFFWALGFLKGVFEPEENVRTP